MKSAVSRPKARAALMEELEHAVRRSSAQGVMFSQTVANCIGISSSDLECLDFLNLEGRVTAGRLAEVTGPAMPAPMMMALRDRLVISCSRCSGGDRTAQRLNILASKI